MRIRTVLGLVSLALVVTAVASCGDVVRSSRAPVFLTVAAINPSTLSSDVINSSGIVFNDQATATLTAAMKNVTVDPTTNNQVTITRYRVVYRRADGRNTPGVDVPYAFDGGATILVIPGSSAAVSFEAVRHDAKAESPLVELITTRKVINAIADVTFFGQDQVGNDVSATGSFFVDFGNF